MGYSRAGFDVVGVDIAPQPHYPFEFHQLDALEAVALWKSDGVWPGVHSFDAIHASPPCQAYSTLGKQQDQDYPDLYDRVRELLEATGLPWVIENVVGAPYRQGVELCGSMFGLQVRRHRNFEASFLMMPPPCDHRAQGTPLGVYGTGGGGVMTRGVKATPAEAKVAMGIDWMTHREIAQAVPPAFAEYVGTQLLAHLGVKS